MRRFYAFMLAMVLIISSFVFSACSSQDGGTDSGNGAASDQTQQSDNGGTENGQGSSNNVSGADQNKVDNTDVNKGTGTNADNADGNNNVVEELGDDAKRTVDDVVNAGQR